MKGYPAQCGHTRGVDFSAYAPRPFRAYLTSWSTYGQFQGTMPVQAVRDRPGSRQTGTGSSSASRCSWEADPHIEILKRRYSSVNAAVRAWCKCRHVRRHKVTGHGHQRASTVGHSRDAGLMFVGGSLRQFCPRQMELCATQGFRVPDFSGAPVVHVCRDNKPS